jgi:hypothetical protein
MFDNVRNHRLPSHFTSLISTIIRTVSRVRLCYQTCQGNPTSETSNVRERTYTWSYGPLINIFEHVLICHVLSEYDNLQFRYTIRINIIVAFARRAIICYQRRHIGIHHNYWSRKYYCQCPTVLVYRNLPCIPALVAYKLFPRMWH